MAGAMLGHFNSSQMQNWCSNLLFACYRLEYIKLTVEQISSDPDSNSGSEEICNTL